MRISQSKNEDVTRLWVTQGQPRSKTRHVHHSGLRLVNYGTLIGLIVEKKAGRIVLITSLKYSDTTTAICNLAAGQAKDAGLAVFRVPNLGASRAEVTANLKFYDGQIADWIDKLKRARATSIEFYRREIKLQIGIAHAYSIAFGRLWGWKGEDCDQIRKGEEAWPASATERTSQ